ncbi:hypothetical protein [Chroococcidiopsis sp.]|uniref:hypothetical protein n=1 Tax=Chroococcidiopsis sp. TaxID=3088168 RepID=UPI003F31B03C
MSIIVEYENQLAYEVERRLNDVLKVITWADAFSTENSTARLNQIILGHQRTERIQYTTDAQTGHVLYWKRYFFEIRVELLTLKNHQKALDLLEQILDDVLAGYQPFAEIFPFVPQDSGNATRNKANGSWIYSASGYANVLSNIKTLTPLKSASDVPLKLVQIAFRQAESTQDFAIFTKQ